jgi:hypothetical protein
MALLLAKSLGDFTQSQAKTKADYSQNTQQCTA